MIMTSTSPKVIIVQSPQPWGKMHISKHHYAIALAKAGHMVYFLNSPNERGVKDFTIFDHPELPNLKLVYYYLNPFMWKHVQFKTRWIYRKYYRSVIQQGLKKFNIQPDEFWCFDPNTNDDLTIFNAKKIIFFAADNVSQALNFKVASQADLVVAVSHVILDSYAQLPNRKLLINHGLSDYFAVPARKRLEQRTFVGGDVIKKVGYVGNLLFGIIHKPTLKKVFESNPGILFYLYGSYHFKTNNFMQDASEEALKFIDQIIHLPNVKLMDAKEPAELAVELGEMDAFLMCYDNIADPNKGSNAHKIMEYLSMGKVTISNRVTTYEGLGLMEMLPDDDITKLPELFHHVVNNAACYNAADKQQKRIEYALKHTYQQHVDTIQSNVYN